MSGRSGEFQNLPAKLEKQNKVEGGHALADQHTYEPALLQGYVPPDQRRRLAKRMVAGVRDPVELVVAA